MKIFRKIRVDMLTKQRTKKYLFYAIGEILLVVMGILIALQINNWNEARKNRAFEVEMLTQIRANLVKDKITLEAIQSRGYLAVSAADKLLDPNTISSNPDSIKFWLSGVISFERFQPLSNAYEVLKSKGIDLISNKQLRFLLGTYYDDEVKTMSSGLDDLKTTFITDWLPMLKENIVEFKFKNYTIVEDMDVFVNSKPVRNLLILNKDNFAASTRYIEKGIQLLERIITMINSELNHK